MTIEEKYCQSCGMPLRKEIDWGQEVDGSPSIDYCHYCYEKGKFTSDCTMEEMIDFCLNLAKDTGMYDDLAVARTQMMSWFPTLKRWRFEG